MKSIILTGSIISAILISVTMLINYSIDSEYEEMKGYVGTEIITGNDTLTVISFSAIENTFMLSNGRTVHWEMIYELKK